MRKVNAPTLLIVFIFLLMFATFGTAWLYPNEPYRIPIKITSPSNLTTYQVLIDLNSTSLTGDNNSHFWLNTRTDGKDIRFSNKDDNQALDFFRETFTDGGRAKFWVELPTISSGDQNIFMYYGSNVSDDNSSWENTFIDDGNGTNMLGWSLNTPSGSPWFSNGTQYQNDSVTGTQDMSRARTFSNALAYAVSVELQNNASTNSEVRYYLFDEGNTNTTYVQYTGSSNTLRFLASGDDGPAACTIAISDGTLYDVNITRDYAGDWTMYANGTSCSVTNVADVSGTDHGFSHASDSAGRADNVWLKNTNAGGEPTYIIQNFQDDGNLTMRIVDEETQAPLQPTLTVNGVNVDVNANGYFDLNTSSLTYPVTIIASLTNYDTRTFTYATAAGITAGSTLGLRTDTESLDIGFTFYGPDEVTALPLYYIEVVRSGVVAARGQTNSDAEITFNLAPQDSAYSIKIYSLGSDTNVLYTYSTVAVTVSRPKDEITNANISPNSFNLDIGGLGLQNYTAQTLPISTIVILGNTQDVYTLRVVDNNADGQQYSARNYVMHQKGNETTLTINPYLVPINDVVLVKITVRDLAIGNPTLPNIRLQLRTGISGTNTVVEDQVTNLAGEAKFSFVSQKIYTLLATNGIQSINYFPESGNPGNISDTDDEFILYIDFNSSDSNFSTKFFDVNYAPTTDYLTGGTQKIDVNATYLSDFSSIIIRLIDQNVTEYSSTCTTSPCNVSFNANLSLFDTNSATVWVQVVTSDTNINRFRTYLVIPYATDTVNQARDWRNQLGPIPLALIMFACIFLALRFMGDSEFQNTSSRVFIVAIIPAPFIWLWWYDNPFIVLAYIGALFGGAGIYLWERNRGS